MTSPTQKQGYNAEQLAENYLQQQGLKPVARNIHFRTGELDLIMQDGQTLVFIEVRYRKNSHFGCPGETVTAAKQQKLVRSALLYCQKYNIQTPWRLDVVAITQAGAQQTPEIHWIPSAITG